MIDQRPAFRILVGNGYSFERDELASTFGDVADDAEFRRAYEEDPPGQSGTVRHVRRRSDGRSGTMVRQARPSLWFDFLLPLAARRRIRDADSSPDAAQWFLARACLEASMKALGATVPGRIEARRILSDLADADERQWLRAQRMLGSVIGRPIECSDARLPETVSPTFLRLVETAEPRLRSLLWACAGGS